MREGYIEKDKRKKILLLGDDLRYFSGVGVISREIVLGTAHHFNWVQIGGAANHPEAGKIIDLSTSVNGEIGIEDSYVRIIPNTGYGDMELLRQVLSMEKPDALMIFTDPRYWTWLFANEREIRQQVPIMYLNIWDDLPYPMYNKPYYESCDALFAISKQTLNINAVVLGDQMENKVLRYIPHGVSNLFKPLEKTDETLNSVKNQIWHGDEPEFRLLYNARNLGRKHAGDLILAWRYFCDSIGPEESRKCELVLHTDIVDNAGTDLGAIVRAFCNPDTCRVRFISSKISTEDLNALYNLCDGVVLPSSNEGWGLSLTEALNCGKMIIATVTGGMQDQMRFEDEDGNWILFTKDFPSNHAGGYSKHGEWAIPVWPNNRSLAGSPITPYIYDDRVSIEDLAEAIARLYELSPEERERRGQKGREWAISREAGFTAEQMSERVIEGIEATLVNFKPRGAFEFLEIKDRPSELLDYDPVNYTITKPKVKLK